MPGNPFAASPIDFSWLGQLPGQYAAGEKWGRERALRKAFAGGLPKGPDGTTDWAAARDILAQFDPEAAFKYGDPSGSSGDFGLNPIYTMGPNGLGLYQPSKSGGVRPIEFPENVRPLEPQQFLNLGTRYQPAGKYTGGQEAPGGVGQPNAAPAGVPGAPGGGVPGTPSYKIDVAGKRSATEQGESEGKAIVNMPLVENATRRLIEGIEEIEKSPGLKNATGLWQSQMMTVNQDTADVEARIAQTTSGGFLQMYNELRGGGAITEAEGAKASGALFRLAQLKQGDASYRNALREAKFEVYELQNVARRRAGMQPLPNPYAGSNTTSMQRSVPQAMPAPQSMPAPAPAPTSGGRPMPTQIQLQLLAQHANNPEAIAAFDENFGAGAADHFLQGGR